jgi:hypothetical protein
MSEKFVCEDREHSSVEEAKALLRHTRSVVAAIAAQTKTVSTEVTDKDSV